jgi:hypothetical protein
LVFLKIVASDVLETFGDGLYQLQDIDKNPGFVHIDSVLTRFAVSEEIPDGQELEEVGQIGLYDVIV